jgi:Protein of unknown function (DUF3500)
MDAARRLELAATTFLDSLDDRQHPQATLSLDDVTRRSWAYTPRKRSGIPVWALDRQQTKIAFKLLATLLAPPAFARAVAVMSLEEVLDEIEGGRSGVRHIGDYWLAVFGRPGDAAWGLRFEGHHVSVNATIVEGEVALTPLFLGANPALVRDGEHVVLAPLQIEEQLGFDVVHALTVEQRSSAVFSEDAPADIVTRNRPRLGGPLDPVGIPLSALGGAAATAARELVRTYLDRFPDGALRPSADDLWFAWAGALEPGIGHYYRLVGQRFLVELDNTQNGANHVHTVVRDPAADFGDDALAAHYGRSHSD